jgi:hypothetical protein
MESNERDILLTKSTTLAINAYCRVMEVHLKMVEQGASPELKGSAKETVMLATEGLRREVELLRFIREEIGRAKEDYQDSSFV